MRIKNTWSVILLGAGILAIDQISKFIMIKKIPDSGIFLINQNFLKIKLETTLNTQAAFSLAIPKTIIFAIILIVIAWLGIQIKQAMTKKENGLAGWLMVVAVMAYSNLLDRILYGGVVDYVAIGSQNFFWPTFNLADALIVTSIFVLLIKYLRLPKTI